MLHTLFAEHPCDGISNVAFATTIWSDNCRYAVTSEENFCVVREGFEAGYLEPLKFEHASKSPIAAGPRAGSWRCAEANYELVNISVSCLECQQELELTAL